MNEFIQTSLAVLGIWGFGAIAVVCYVLAYFLAWFGRGIWGWVDDEKHPFKDYNLLSVYHWKLRGGIVDHDYYNIYRLPNKSDSKDATMLFIEPMLLIALLCLSIQFWYVAIWVVTVAVILRMARMGRRLAKKFELHVKDPDAHKKES